MHPGNRANLTQQHPKRYAGLVEECAHLTVPDVLAGLTTDERRTKPMHMPPEHPNVVLVRTRKGAIRPWWWIVCPQCFRRCEALHRPSWSSDNGRKSPCTLFEMDLANWEEARRLGYITDRELQERSRLMERESQTIGARIQHDIATLRRVANLGFGNMVGRVLSPIAAQLHSFIGGLRWGNRRTGN